MKYFSYCCDAPAVLKGNKFYCTECQEWCEAYYYENTVEFELYGKENTMEIKETLELLTNLKKALLEIYEATKDQKVDIKEIFGLSDNLLDLVKDFQDIQTVIDEMQDLDKAESKQIAEVCIEITFVIISIVNNFRAE